MQRGMNALRSSEAKLGKPPRCAVFFTMPFIRGDYFVRKEALVQLCVGCVGSPGGGGGVLLENLGRGVRPAP